MTTNLFGVGSDLVVYRRYRLERSTIIEAVVLSDEQTKELYARTMSTMPTK